MTHPLDGVTVIEAGEGIPAAYCCWMLGVLGADVIKVEPPAGDSTRRLGPFPHDIPDREQSALYLHLNRNKRSIVLDLKSATGQELFRELVTGAAVLVEHGDPGWLNALGLGHESLVQDHPELVATTITPFGQEGPYRDFTASEITLMALGGLMNIAGEIEREPLKLAGSPAHYSTGLFAFTSTLMALTLAEASGIGQLVDVSVLEGLTCSHFQDLVEFEYTGNVRRRGAGRMPIPTQDGFISFAVQAHQFPEFRRLILGADAAPEGASEDLIGRDRQSLEGEMDHQILEWALQRTKYEAYVEGQTEAHIPAAFIAEMQDILDSPQYEARGYFAELDHPDGGRIRFPGLPAQMSGVEWEHRRAPRLGEHTVEILNELTDLSADEIAEVRAAGVI